ncbi:MAG: methylmalonyl-CoA mutase family protein [Bacteroidales bacterium]
MAVKQEKKPDFLKDFPAVSTREWEEKIIEDLKGADYEKRLVWKTTDGISARPYYRSEHLETLSHMGSLPGEAPFVRGTGKRDNEWDIRQDFDEENLAAANVLALKAIDKGVQAVGLHAGEVEGEADLAALIKGIDPAGTAIHFIQGKDYPALFNHFLKAVGSKPCRGSLNFDPLGDFLMYGGTEGNLEANIDKAVSLIGTASARQSGFRVITINGQHFHNAGAGIVQELAFSLSQANEYLARLTDKGLNVDEITPHMQFRLAVGSNYFLEIAKLRAMKMGWSRIVEQYQPASEQSMKISIHITTSTWNKSLYDPYVNLLRTTTEAMSAAIAGVDSITVNPFDLAFKKPDDFSLRVARNQQIVLKHESYFNKVVDPSAGSYYIENLTDSIAAAVWDLFVGTEEQGGFVPITQNGFIREEIEKTCQKRDMDIAMRKQVFVGTNQYPNAGERMLDKLQPTAKVSDLGGLRPYRGTQAFEALRLAVENHERKGFDTPKVFLLTYGNLVMRKARASFSANFFGVAGYRIIEGAGYTDPGSGARDALASGAHIVVLCSSDEEYPELCVAATEIKRKAPKTQVVVAGHPKEFVDQLKESGVDQFVHLRTNALDALQRLNQTLDIH